MSTKLNLFWISLKLIELIPDGDWELNTFRMDIEQLVLQKFTRMETRTLKDWTVLAGCTEINLGYIFYVLCGEEIIKIIEKACNYVLRSALYPMYRVSLWGLVSVLADVFCCWKDLKIQLFFFRNGNLLTKKIGRRKYLGVAIWYPNKKSTYF